MRTLFLASTLALLLASSTASAHFDLMAPPEVKTTDTSGGKGAPPCGPDTGMAATPTPVQGGHPLMIKVNETVRHGGFYRVALAINSRSELPVDNVVYDASNKVLPPNGNPMGTSDHADVQDPPVFPILADNMFKHDQAGPQPMAFMGEVMIPNVNCARCTLQVIEFMHPHGYNGAPGTPTAGGYFYHHCAELKITADPALPLFGGGSDAGTDAGKDAGADTSGTGAAGTMGAAGNGAAGVGAAGAGAAGTSGAAGVGAAGTNGAAGSTAGAAGSSGAAGLGAAGIAAGAAGANGAAGNAGAAGRGGGGNGGGGCSVAGTSSASWLLGFLMLGAFVARRSRAKRRP
jgi:MYXO-CTERM domain-containing protein